ncbi:TRZ/ATZ family hydrolase [Azonexus hydrophilus]|uniref:TRZ/ATZ family hydrolase n=1 Tax=Azonexus hydrophilus TaxID=418702 RepID=UPI0003FC3A0C|nr:TRZ/ATZ family hydrolase [Azonexus hydrophilus]
MPNSMTPTPETIDLLIEARWIAPVDTDEVLSGHAVAIDNGHILAVLPAAEARRRYQAREHRQLDQHILIPGLINLHTHAAMSLMRGIADDLPLQEWLQQHIWPAEAAHVSSQFVLDGTRLACAEMLRGGITCFNDMYFFPDAAAQAATEFGMRAALGVTTLEFPGNYASDADDYIAKGLAAREAFRDHPLISFCLAPHAPYTVSDRTFQRITTLAEQLDLPIHCHLHETRQEITDSGAQHGKRPLQRLQELGLIGPGFIGVHAVHLDDAEIASMAEAGCSIAHCPTSNLKLASGFARITEMHRAGINIGLGTDSAASNNRLDMFGEMRLATLLAKGLSGDASALPAIEVLRMATLNGARALGLDEVTGSITAGKSADLCAVSLEDIVCQPCFDPLSQLIHVAGREQVSDVWIAGKCLVEHKTLRIGKEFHLDASAALWQNKLEVSTGKQRSS